MVLVIHPLQTALPVLFEWKRRQGVRKGVHYDWWLRLHRILVR